MTNQREECWHACPVCGTEHAHTLGRGALLDDYWRPCSPTCEVAWAARSAARAARTQRRIDYLRAEAAL